MTRLQDQLRSATDRLSGVTPSMLPGWVVTGGVGAWVFVGIAAAIAIVAWLFAESSGISVPLVLAAVIGIVAYPACERMVSRGVPKQAAASITLLALLGAVVLVVWVTFAGVISQWPAIQLRVADGVSRLAPMLDTVGVHDTDAVGGRLTSLLPTSGDDPVSSALLGSLAAVLRGGVQGLISLAFRLFIGLMLLYYVLTDFPVLAEWLGRHMWGLPVAVGEGIVEDAVESMRAYFRATTISGFVVAAVIGATMAVIGVPLAFSVALVTFMTVYIPFFGAIFSGIFAFIVTLSAQGLPEAILILLVVLITQNVLQTIIYNRILGTSLNLHPIVVLVVTMLGSIFGGLLGAALGAPVAALAVKAWQRLSQAFDNAEAAESAFEAFDSA